MKGLRSYLAQGYWVRFVDIRDNFEFGHEFCGPHRIRGATSPNSGRPLLQLLKLHLTDTRLNLSYPDVSILPLLFSWTCDISQGPLLYQLIDETAIEILRYRAGAAYQDFPYPGYPEHFPVKLVSLVPLSIEEQSTIRKVNNEETDQVYGLRPDLCRPEHQVGGEPFLVQPWIELSCPKCSRGMPFLASIGDHSGSTTGFTGNIFVQTIFSLCVSCRTIGAYQQCD